MRYCKPPSFDDFYIPSRDRNKDDKDTESSGSKSLKRGSAFKRREKKDEDEKPARGTSSRPSSKPNGLSGFGNKEAAPEPKKTTVRRRSSR